MPQAVHCTGEDARISSALLLDTCALIRLANGDAMTAESVAAIDHAGRRRTCFANLCLGDRLVVPTPERTQRDGSVFA